MGPPFLTRDSHCWEWLMVFKKMSENHFDIQRSLGQDLWPTEPKSNRIHLLVMANVHVRYENFVINGFQDNQRNHLDI